MVYFIEFSIKLQSLIVAFFLVFKFEFFFLHSLGMLLYMDALGLKISPSLSFRLAKCFAMKSMATEKERILFKLLF